MIKKIYCRGQKIKDGKQKAGDGIGVILVVKNIFSLFFVVCFLVSIAGCDAFVRKFTRKPKNDKIPHEELVLSPVEYKSNMNKADLYQQYFLYWKSWQDELTDSLLRNTNQKKHLECVNEAIKNLEEARDLLKEEKSNKLTVYIKELIKLRSSIESNIYSIDAEISRSDSERIKRNVLRDFSYPKVKDSLL